MWLPALERSKYKRKKRPSSAKNNQEEALSIYKYAQFLLNDITATVTNWSGKAIIYEKIKALHG